MSKKYLKKTFVLQKDTSDCGVACLQSLIKFYGGHTSLENLRNLSGTTKKGTTLLGLCEASINFGFDAGGYEGSLDELAKQPNPTILHVTLDDFSEHYIICYGFKKNKFIVGDPSFGITEYDSDYLKSIWKSKFCLILKPNDTFSKSNSTVKNEKEWFLRLLTPDFRWIWFSVILGLFTAGLGMVMSIFTQKLIDEILPSKSWDKLITSLVLVAFLLLTRIFFTALRDFFLTRQTKEFNNRITNNFYASLLNIPKSFFDTRKIGELVARLNDTERVQKVLKQIIENLIVDFLTIIVALLFVFYYSWQIGLIVVCSLPLYFFSIYRLSGKIIKAQHNIMKSYSLNESNYISSMQGVAIIKNHNRQNTFRKKNQSIYGFFQNEVYKLGLINIKLTVLSGVLGVIFLSFVLIYASVNVYFNNMLLGELVAILGIVSLLLPSVGNSALMAVPISEAKVAFRRMFEFASIDEETEGKFNINNFDSLSVKELSFRFPGRKSLLKKVNLEVKANECIAIVGESGCGKSTLCEILQKFYLPETGEIVVNNQYSLDIIKNKDWKNIIGVVPQHIHIFNGNIVDNILLEDGDGSTILSDFYKRYGFQDFIDSLPEGDKTIVGEEGINLSGGEKQVVGLMRALYKNPSFLILDEFTSAMDRNTERKVITLLDNLKLKLAILIVTHRLSAIKALADRIYVIENGAIVDSGNHRSLMKTKNFYSDYWKDYL